MAEADGVAGVWKEAGAGPETADEAMAGIGAGAVGAVGAVGAIGAGAIGAGVALIYNTSNIATSIFTCCSFVKCKKDPFSSVILLTPSSYCFW